jgi:hypothetical protein
VILKIIEAGAIGVRIAQFLAFILIALVIDLFEHAFTAAQNKRRGEGEEGESAAHGSSLSWDPAPRLNPNSGAFT